jgi:hypothetical protein
MRPFRLLRCCFRRSGGLFGSLFVVMLLNSLLGWCRCGRHRGRSCRSSVSGEGANCKHRGNQGGDQLFHGSLQIRQVVLLKALHVRLVCASLYAGNASRTTRVDNILSFFAVWQSSQAPIYPPLPRAHFLSPPSNASRNISALARLPTEHVQGTLMRRHSAFSPWLKNTP